jgi:hypothetical protein
MVWPRARLTCDAMARAQANEGGPRGKSGRGHMRHPPRNFASGKSRLPHCAFTATSVGTDGHYQGDLHAGATNYRCPASDVVQENRDRETEMNASKSKNFRVVFVLDEARFRALDALLMRVAEENIEALRRHEEEKEKSYLREWLSEGATADERRKLEERAATLREEAVQEGIARYGKVRWEIECSDGSTLRNLSLQDAIDFPNHSGRAIASITAQVDSRSGTDVSIAFDPGLISINRSASYRISGSDRSVVYLSSDLDGFILSAQPWYGFIQASYSLWPYVLFGVIAAVILSQLLLSWEFRAKIEKEYVGGMVLWIVATVQAGFFAAVVLFPLVSGVRWLLFPMGVFAVGEGKSRHRKLQWVHNFVFVIIVIGAVVGVFRNYLAKVLGINGS